MPDNEIVGGPPIELAWNERLSAFEAHLRNLGLQGQSIERSVRAAKTFAWWAAQRGIGPKASAASAAMDDFNEHLRSGNLSPNSQNMARSAAGRLIKMLEEDSAADSTPADSTNSEEQEADAPAASDTSHPDLHPDREDHPPYPSGGGDGADGSESSVDADEEGAESTPRATVAANTKPIVIRNEIRMPPGRRAAGDAPKRDEFKGKLPSLARVHVYKRLSGGKKVYIDEYTLDDIGPSTVTTFLKEHVDPIHGEASGLTTYEVARVGKDGADDPVPAVIPIQSPPRRDANVSSLRELLGVLGELQRGSPQPQQFDPAIQALQKRVEGNGGGSGLTDLVALQMLREMRPGGGPNADTMQRVLDLFERQHRPPESPPHITPAAPPAEDPLAKVAARALDKMAERMNEPPPEPPNIVDQLEQFKLMREAFRDPSIDVLRETVNMLRQEMQAMRAAIEKKSTSAEDLLHSFQAAKQVVQTLAPSMNLGGVGGILGSLITPQLAQTLGDAFAISLRKFGVSTPPQLQSGAPQKQEIRRPPAAAQPYIDRLKVEKDRTAQTIEIAHILGAYYADPTWGPAFEPYAKALAAGEHGPVRKMIQELLSAFSRTDLSTDEALIGEAIRLIASQLPTAAAVPSVPAASA